jgi:hypothetical protein
MNAIYRQLHWRTFFVKLHVSHVMSDYPVNKQKPDFHKLASQICATRYKKYGKKIKNLEMEIPHPILSCGV